MAQRRQRLWSGEGKIDRDADLRIREIQCINSAGIVDDDRRCTEKIGERVRVITGSSRNDAIAGTQNTDVIVSRSRL